jgi:hypothetical protein
MATTQVNKTTQVVREAMRIVSKDVRLPKVVREGVVKMPASTVKSK